ncbi:MAG: hypothetical protein EBS01_04270 [Verrucomicrobia bacterium]|nr:hypothetical protein [Verrucomicrobiota bacterium]
MSTSYLRPSLRAAAALVITTSPAWALDSGQVKGQTAATPDPITHPASEAPMQAAGSIHLPADWKLELFAAEPLLSDPVAMSFDERGRLYIALHHRNRHGRRQPVKAVQHQRRAVPDGLHHTLGLRAPGALLAIGGGARKAVPFGRNPPSIDHQAQARLIPVARDVQ